ncbi:hypothetical protein MMC28_009945 [Mycoblastus sanguinarius]|nr:hypothetical protein [Mycoblastus sanguinarius]
MAPRSRKPPVEIKPEFVLVPGQEPPRKKKKKNAPDRPQPQWMFPPDEENPVLNPKPKLEAQRLKDEKDRDDAIKFLKYKSVTAPLKAPPPQLLLTLVGAFLSSYGFHSASRIYTTQLQSRTKLDEWRIELGGKLPKGFPDLVKIFKDWYKDYEAKTQMDDTSSSSGEDDSSDAKAAKKVKKSKKQAKADAKAREVPAAKVNAKDETSSSGSSDDEGGSDVEMKDEPPGTKAIKKDIELRKAKSSSPLTSSSSTDSNADDEKEATGATLPTSKSLQTPTVNGKVNKLKRKVSSSGPSSSDSDLDSDSDASTSAAAKKLERKSAEKEKIATPERSKETTPAKVSVEPSSSSDTSSSDSESAKEASKPVVATTITTAVATAEGASSSSSGSTSSSTDSDEPDFAKPTKVVKATTITTSRPVQILNKAPSDSSETLQATSARKPSTANPSLSTSASTSSSDSSEPKATATATATTTKRKRSSSPTEAKSKKFHKQNTPFQRVPKDTPVDPKMASNAYRAYDYADKAHQDLSVTKGKGFTKEKNKKKRGSYRGGQIDVSGGKGVKFED